jgi:membrane-associated protease RseP (regulator of RpoE activity)
MKLDRRRVLVHLGLLVVTGLTTTVAGAIWDGGDPFASLHDLARGLPFSVSLLAILLCHESGHYLMCVRHGIDASLPYFLPAPPLLVPWGTFGAFIRVRSRFPDRDALFDMGAAGPWAGFVVALVVLVIGLRLSHAGADPGGATLVFGDSILTSWLTRRIVGADPDTVFIHPVGLAGWFGLLVTSLNLLPAGQLDGGHVVYAALGRRTPLLGALVAAGALYLGFRVWPGWYLWGAILLLMTRLGHPPTLDDRAPLGPRRLVGAVASLILLALTFVPDPIRIVP